MSHTVLQVIPRYFFLLLSLLSTCPYIADAQFLLTKESPVRRASAPEKLAQAITYQTVSVVNGHHQNGEEFLALHNYLREAFPVVHQHLQSETVNDYSLLYTWQGKDASLKPVLISAHLDVVPVEAATKDDWSMLPFEGQIQDGYVWGRGTMDDKYRVVAILEAVERLLVNGFRPNRTVYLAFGHDEEVGGYNGAGKISKVLEERGVQLEVVFDEGLAVAEDVIPGVKGQLALVGMAAKGNVNLKLTVHGEGGHSSVPPNQTPIDILSMALVRLQENPFEPRMTPTTRETLEVLADKMGGKYKFAVRHYGLFKNRILKMLAQDQATDALIRTKMTPTIFEAGDKYNVLPRVASAVVNVRILNGEDINTVMKHITESIADERVRVEVYGSYTPPTAVTPSNTWIYAALQNAISDVFPDALVVPALFPGATDSRHYGNLTSNIFRFAPQVVNRESATLIHNVNEKIALDVFAGCIRFYETLLQYTCSEVFTQQFVRKGNYTIGLPAGLLVD